MGAGAIGSWGSRVINSTEVRDAHPTFSLSLNTRERSKSSPGTRHPTDKCLDYTESIRAIEAEAKAALRAPAAVTWVRQAAATTMSPLTSSRSEKTRRTIRLLPPLAVGNRGHAAASMSRSLEQAIKGVLAASGDHIKNVLSNHADITVAMRKTIHNQR